MLRVMRVLGVALFLFALSTGCASRDAPSTKSDANAPVDAGDDTAEQEVAPGADTRPAPDTALPDTSLADTQMSDAAED
jgi:hypothetical protein